MWCTETTLFPRRQSAENAGRHWNSTEEVLSPHRTCVTEQLELARQVARIQHYSDIGPISFFFFFKLWYLAENKREKIAFPKYPLLREM